MALTDEERDSLRADLEILEDFRLPGIECRADAQQVRSHAALLLADLESPTPPDGLIDEAADLAARALQLAEGQAPCTGRVVDPYEARPWALAGFALLTSSLLTLAWSLR
jgi:hypothetical protein